MRPRYGLTITLVHDPVYVNSKHAWARKFNSSIYSFVKTAYRVFGSITSGNYRSFTLGCLFAHVFRNGQSEQKTPVYKRDNLGPVSLAEKKILIQSPLVCFRKDKVLRLSGKDMSGVTIAATIHHIHFSLSYNVINV